MKASMVERRLLLHSKSRHKAVFLIIHFLPTTFIYLIRTLFTEENNDGYNDFALIP